jgi:glycerol uptake facilitator-like aquaporin
VDIYFAAQILGAVVAGLLYRFVWKDAGEKKMVPDTISAVAVH